MSNNIDYEKQLQESNEQLREKLAEALNILDEKKRILDEKVGKYGSKTVNKEWEPLVTGAISWEQYKNSSQPMKNSKKK